LVLWIGTAIAFPWLHRQIAAFVDRIVLRRANYATVIDGLSVALTGCESEGAVLRRVRATLEPALSAESVQCRSAASGPPRAAEVLIPTAEEPRTVLTIGRLAGGRRLLSDDIVMLDRVALAAARRIDAVRLNDERYARLMREREISALAAEAELKALRAQINPHFLFNALTTLGYLIQSTPNRAFEMLMHMTTLLRSALRSEGEFTTLRHERELVNCYLEIERERFEERLRTEVDVPDELLDVTIPSLIVQPLVENAIKHGIARSRDGGRVVVRARLEKEHGAHVRITVSNSGAPLHGRTPEPEGGIGLKNVERRLHCYYGDTASLALATVDTGETVAEILVPVTSAPEVYEPSLVRQ
jgi:LytS/YehU family sensor histidine kinase